MLKNEIKQFEHEEFGKVRAVNINGELWWVLKDVCAALELNSPHKVAERLDDDERNQIPLIDNLGRKQKTAVVNESGLYAVSDKPNAKVFRRWITHEVLPSIRKHGAYIAEDTLSQMLNSPEFTEGLLDALEEEHAKNTALENKVGELAPKARYCDKVLMGGESLAVSVIAKDYGMSAVAFNQLLHELGIQYRVGNTWLLYKDYANKGYTKTKTYHTPNGSGVVHTQWLQKGRLFLFEALALSGIYPQTATGRAFII